MHLATITLTHFRTYKRQTITFAPLTIIVGENTVGKTNILEAVHMLSTGKSFRADKDLDTIQFGADFARVDAILQDDSERVKITVQLLNNSAVFHKRYLLNDVGKRLVDFASFFCSVIFSPQDLEIISESPTMRRRYLDGLLSATSSAYRSAHITYTKALRQRNRLLGLIKEGKRRYSADEFVYWNSLLLEHAKTISEHRQRYIDYVNTTHKNVYPLELSYDASYVTSERLEKYKDAELASGVTLIGPQRDDIVIQFPNTHRLIREFASRGEQRLAILQLKLFELTYVKENTNRQPILLLDDVFSELDAQNIDLISRLLPEQQTIITTTHIQDVPKEILSEALVLHLPEDLHTDKT
ncbi:MAG TPA: DNA replication and repair protein RecF [Candidatus Levybacteria bacterium]|nr:DNA replication and repair protein RecF [Candidatus Levybacteria bacterium]